MATYGIDLGTTYSCIASIDEFGRPAVARNEFGEDTTPSVVYFESPDNVVVGRTAKSSALLDPDHVVTHIKRQMGQDVTFEFHGQSHSPESISALILKELAQTAEHATNEPVRDVVITVPAYFGVAEREATKNAGRIAGLHVLQVVPEPVAAALHYEALSHGSDRTILVFDLGGGTFDTTVIRLQDKDIKVVCTDGDHHLGGADWDARIVAYLMEQFTAVHPDLDPGGDEQFQQGLYTDAEQLKKDLSRAQTRKYNVRFGPQVAPVELSRETFEELTSELLEQALAITKRTIDTARGLGVNHFDEVLLVGGSSRMPAIAEQLKERFGFDARLHDPDLAVAKGAALFAEIESVKVTMAEKTGDGPSSKAVSEAAAKDVANRLGLSTEKVRELAKKTVTTVVPRAFGIKVIDSNDPNLEREFVEHLLPANTPLPANPSPQMFATVVPNQVEIKIEVWEQAGSTTSPELVHNAHIGEGLITGLPPLPAGSPMEVTMSMDEMGTLRVDAVELSTKNELHIELAIGGLDEAEVEAARNAVARYALSE